jgi:putative SOS response-associated peptidase YedK
LFGFLTTDANDVVGPIHPKAMPVILTTLEEIETWLTAPADEALRLQRPLPDGTLKIVAHGEKEDGPEFERVLTQVKEAIGRREPSIEDLKKTMKDQGDLF